MGSPAGVWAGWPPALNATSTAQACDAGEVHLQRRGAVDRQRAVEPRHDAGRTGAAHAVRVVHLWQGGQPGQRVARAADIGGTAGRGCGGSEGGCSARRQRRQGRQHQQQDMGRRCHHAAEEESRSRLSHAPAGAAARVQRGHARPRGASRPGLFRLANLPQGAILEQKRRDHARTRLDLTISQRWYRTKRRGNLASTRRFVT